MSMIREYSGMSLRTLANAWSGVVRVLAELAAQPVGDQIAGGHR
jgi:hypothetical protein